MIIQKKFKNVLITLAAVAFCVTFAPNVRAQERVYIDISPPEALAAIAYGISPRGDVVGTYVAQEETGYVQRGFLLSKGNYTPIAFPGADGTDARGIGPNGEIVGIYWYDTDPLVGTRGFMRTRGGAYINVKFEGSEWEIPQRILPDGTILGCKHDHNTSSTMKGVTWYRKSATMIDANASMNNGATPDGHLVVGLWTNPATSRTEGYTITHGVFETFMVPGSNFTAAWDVNPDGVIVGAFRTQGTTAIRGFAGSGTDFETLHFPGSVHTRAFGINPAGTIVGSYVTASGTFAYLSRIPQ